MFGIWDVGILFFGIWEGKGREGRVGKGRKGREGREWKKGKGREGRKGRTRKEETCFKQDQGEESLVRINASPRHWHHGGRGVAHPGVP